MSSDGVNSNRRNLLIATAGVGALGVVGASVPFIKMWLPSERAKAAGAPISIDISKLNAGQKIDALWRGKPVWVVRRTTEMLDGLDLHREDLKDPDSENPDQQPDYATNPTRSRTPEYLVVLGVCTHLGCSPKFVPELEPQSFDQEWNGGFFCPCHNSRFDLAGRVYNGVPAPTNLSIPPHFFEDENTIVIGLEGGEEGDAA